MEKLQSIKPKLIKGILLFLGFIFVCTLLSRSIYEYLLPVVSITKVREGSVEVVHLGDGKIGLDEEALKAKQAVLLPSIGGQVVEVYKAEGEKVQKGEAICKIQQGDYETSLKNKELDLAKTTFEKERLVGEIEGKEAEQKRLLEAYTAKQKELEEVDTCSQVVDLEEAIKSQEALVSVNEKLYSSNLLATKSYEDEKAKLVRLQKELKEKKESLQEELKEKLATLQKDKEEVDRSLAKLKNDYSLEEKKEEIEKDKSLIETLISPIDGYVYSLNVAAGAYVERNDKLVVIAPYDLTYNLSFPLEDEVAEEVQMGQQVEFVFAERPYEAKVIKKKFQEETGKTLVSCELAEKVLQKMDLEMGSFKIVSVQIVNKSNTYPMTVDNSAIRSVYSEHYVWVIEESEGIGRTIYKVREVPVTILEEGDYKSALSGNIDRDAQLVNGYRGTLEDGQEVNLK